MSQAGESRLIFQRRKLRPRGASRLTVDLACPAQGTAGRLPALLMSAPGLSTSCSCSSRITREQVEGKHSACVLREASHKYNIQKEGGGKTDAESKDIRFRAFSGPAVSKDSAGSLGLHCVYVHACVCVRVPSYCGGHSACWRVSVRLWVITAPRLSLSSLWPSPGRFLALRQPDVSQMFLTSCLAPCSVCVFILDSLLNNNHFKKSFS